MGLFIVSEIPRDLAGISSRERKRGAVAGCVRRTLCASSACARRWLGKAGCGEARQSRGLGSGGEGGRWDEAGGPLRVEAGELRGDHVLGEGEVWGALGTP